MAVLINKTELAAELGVSRPRISQLIARGLPVEPDGRINLELACYWVLSHLSPQCELNTESSSARWNAREIISLIERARARGDPTEYGAPDAA
jgi:hypothetical protein